MTTVTRARGPRADSAQNRAGILTAAAELMARDPHASVDAIARAAGLSRRALYGHFDDRDALVREVIASGAVRFNAIAASVTDPDARVALARLAARLWREAAAVQVAAAIALDAAHVAETADALAPLRRRVAVIVQSGQDAGTLRADVTTPTLARLVEEAARGVVAAVDASSPEARAIAVRAVLSIAGLSWQQTETLLAQHPDILEETP